MLLFFFPFVLTKVIRYLVTCERVRFTASRPCFGFCHTVTLKSQCFAFGGELFTHTTSTTSGGVTIAKPFSCGEFSYCHKIHKVPESCVAYREVWGEALTGVLTGQPLSHEMYIKLPGADVVLLTEGNIIGCDTASATWTRRGLRPWHVNTISTREPGDLPSDHLPVSEMARTGKTRSHSR